MPTTIIQTRQYREFRAQMKAIWQAQRRPCSCCGHPIDYDGEPNQPDSFELDHIISRKKRPDLALDPTNAQPMRSECNRRKGAGAMRPTIGENTEDW
jgi:5-methylcytosine-specific restriction endonuclease McrA